MTWVIVQGRRHTAIRLASERLNGLLNRERIDSYAIPGYYPDALPHVDPADPANVPAVELVERLPRPIPQSLVPHSYVSEGGRFFWGPIDEHDRHEWQAKMERLLDRHRQEHCLVIADVHL